jgi:hypothetical protein
MTMSSLRIVALPENATVEVLESGLMKAPVVQSLSAHADACGPYHLQDWAKARGHALYYVDNCWVRARVRGSDVPAFLREVLKGAATLDPDIHANAEYLIEAEEY